MHYVDEIYNFPDPQDGRTFRATIDGNKWTKFSVNAASAVLGWGVLIIRDGDISEHESVNLLYVLILVATDCGDCERHCASGKTRLQCCP